MITFVIKHKQAPELNNYYKLCWDSIPLGENPSQTGVQWNTLSRSVEPKKKQSHNRVSFCQINRREILNRSMSLQISKAEVSFLHAPAKWLWLRSFSRLFFSFRRHVVLDYSLRVNVDFRFQFISRFHIS